MPNKRNALESSWKQLPHPPTPVCGKIVFHTVVPGAKKVGDHWSKGPEIDSTTHRLWRWKLVVKHQFRIFFNLVLNLTWQLDWNDWVHMSLMLCSLHSFCFSSFSSDIFYWPKFEFTAPIFCYVQSSVKHIQ